ncbi:hypothetical protein N9X34_04205 [Alphaproteobacteria bacterium]|nr:hypothetical protein [Alphaproteobacteria bacterium]
MFNNYIPTEILDRIPNFLKLEFQLVGIKTLLHAMVILFIIKLMKVGTFRLLTKELQEYLILFLMTSFLSFLFNRILIISSAFLIGNTNFKSLEWRWHSRFNSIMLVQAVWLVFVIMPSILLLLEINRNADWEMYN